MSDQAMKKCPYCGEEIRAEAIKCRWCGEFLNTMPHPETSSADSICHWGNTPETHVAESSAKKPNAASTDVGKSKSESPSSHCPNCKQEDPPHKSSKSFVWIIVAVILLFIIGRSCNSGITLTDEESELIKKKIEQKHQENMERERIFRNKITTVR